MIGPEHYFTLSAALFAIGLFGLLTRRNSLLVLLSIELMLNAANLSFVSLAAHRGDLAGQAVVFFTMLVAAAEVTVGLAIIMLLFRKHGSVSTEAARNLKW